MCQTLPQVSIQCLRESLWEWQIPAANHGCLSATVEMAIVVTVFFFFAFMLNQNPFLVKLPVPILILTSRERKPKSPLN